MRKNSLDLIIMNSKFSFLYYLDTVLYSPALMSPEDCSIHCSRNVDSSMEDFDVKSLAGIIESHNREL